MLLLVNVVNNRPPLTRSTPSPSHCSHTTHTIPHLTPTIHTSVPPTIPLLASFTPPSTPPPPPGDGGDNLSDDTDAIVTASTIFKLNPALHVVTELLHGAHAPFLRPTGATLNDAQVRGDVRCSENNGPREQTRR